MKQAIMVEPGKIEFCQVEKPTIRDDEVLLQTKQIGICGSDIHVFHGKHPYTSYPVVQGHEVSEVVAETGDAYEAAIRLVAGEKLHFEDYLQAYHAIEQSNGEYMKVMIQVEQ